MNRPPVAVVHQLARAGGTLVNRCLGSMHGIVVLSEVHPCDPQSKLVFQAKNWFELLDEHDVSWVRETMARPPMESFAALVELLARRCRERDRYLVLRDWTHLDFLGVPFVRDPPMRMRTESALRDRCELRQAFLVRHPLEQYLSSLSRPGMAPHLSPPRFLTAYVAFAREAANKGFLRYEDLVADPDEVLRNLCTVLNIPFDVGYKQRWPDYVKLTGDKTGPSRGFARKAIVPLPPRCGSDEVRRAFLAEPRYEESLRLLGYENA